MPTLPPEFATLIIAVQPLFSEHPFSNAALLLTGALLIPGRRTVTTALPVMGHTPTINATTSITASSGWSARHAARTQLTLLVESLAGEGPLV